MVLQEVLAAAEQKVPLEVLATLLLPLHRKETMVEVEIPLVDHLTMALAVGVPPQQDQTVAEPVLEMVEMEPRQASVDHQYLMQVAVEAEADHLAAQRGRVAQAAVALALLQTALLLELPEPLTLVAVVVVHRPTILPMAAVAAPA
jgi:hypothetical protein